ERAGALLDLQVLILGRFAQCFERRRTGLFQTLVRRRTNLETLIAQVLDPLSNLLGGRGLGAAELRVDDRRPFYRVRRILAVLLPAFLFPYELGPALLLGRNLSQPQAAHH